ncbi:MAG: hypothetical protein KDA79_15595 [Planctomycetaceae bacterium]|nr:hypothetical protein [Planctomycetaceae bacterium]
MLLAVLKFAGGIQAVAVRRETSHTVEEISRVLPGRLDKSVQEFTAKADSTLQKSIAFAFVESVILMLTGWFLYRRTFRWFCLFGSLTACLTIPLGTALGIAGLIVIQSSNARPLFSRPGMQAA